MSSKRHYKWSAISALIGLLVAVASNVAMFANWNSPTAQDKIAVFLYFGIGLLGLGILAFVALVIFDVFTSSAKSDEGRRKRK